MFQDIDTADDREGPVGEGKSGNSGSLKSKIRDGCAGWLSVYTKDWNFSQEHCYAEATAPHIEQSRS